MDGGNFFTLAANGFRTILRDHPPADSGRLKNGSQHAKTALQGGLIVRGKYLNMLAAAVAAVGFITHASNAVSAGDACCDLACNACDAGCCDGAGCDSGCCDSIGCDSCCGSSWLPLAGCGKHLDALARQLDCCGLIRPGDHCFNDFISPMINFVYFEDPRTVTELRPIFVSHQVPNTIGNGIAAGGSIQLLAMQFRIALTDRLSLIAAKDGYIFDNTEGALDGLLDSGWADVSVGLKYNLIRDTCSGTIASAGFSYEIPMGSNQALQSVADGEFHLFATAGQRILGGNGHLLTAFGYRFPVDDDLQTSAVHWSNHIDVMLTKRTYLFTEVAWWHWTDDASAGAALGVAGQDLFNLSASDVDGNDLVTQNVGLRYKPRGNVETGVAFEFPLTEFKDVIDNRVVLDLILRY